MSYIGRGLDKISNIEHLDTITFDGSSSYSLTKNSVAFTPNSAQSLIVSIDGVVQSDNFTVSGSTIDFGVAIPSTSTCDFIKHFGTGVAFTPADGTVGTSQIADSSVNLTSKVTGTLPVANGGTGVTTASALANTGNLVLLNTVTTTDATTTNIEFDSTYINSTYDTYKIFSQVHPVTDNVSLNVRMSVSGTFQTGASYYGQGLVNDGATAVNNNATDNWDVALGVGNASGEGASTDFTLLATNDTNIPTMMIGTISMRSFGGNHGMQTGSYCVNSADAHDGIRFYWSSGNFDTGSKISLYGVKQ